MRAVNLIPSEQRRGGDRSGGAVYGLLGGLALLVVLASAHVLMGNTVTSRQADLQRLQGETTRAQSEAGALAPYRDFASMRVRRTDTVRALASSRFDWAPIMRKLGQVLPRDVRLLSLLGTVAPGVDVGSASGGSGASSSLRNALPVPAIEVSGCARTQAQVARVMARLRLISGVTRVSLAASKKDENAGAAGATPGDGGPGQPAGQDCQSGRPNDPKFEIVAFFGAPTPGATPPAGAAPGASPTPGAGGTG